MPSHSEHGVTVVIPTRDRLSLLQASVESVRQQRFAGWRLVVVDDASSDGTHEWVVHLGDARVEITRCDANVERSAARNIGLQRVDTEYVLFLDDDDVLCPGALAGLTQALSSYPEAFAGAGARVLFDEAGHRRRLRWPFWTVCRPPWPELLTGWVAVAGQTLFRTAHLREVGGWPEGMIVAEDQDLWLRLGYARPAVLVPQTVLKYRLHGMSRAPANTRVIERQLREHFVAALPEHDRRVGEQALVAWREIIGYYRSLAASEHRAAGKHLLTAVRSAPWLLMSPIVGPGIAAATARALTASALPEREGLALERILRRGRELARRYPRQNDDYHREELAFWSLPLYGMPLPRGRENRIPREDS